MNPYEIRLELLKLAYEILRDEHHALRQKEDLEWSEMCSLFNEGKISQLPQYNLPKIVTAEDITQKAELLNTFISKGN